MSIFVKLKNSINLVVVELKAVGSFIEFVFDEVRGIIKTCVSWLRNIIEPKTVADVNRAANIINKALNQETTTKYVTACREKEHINDQIKEIETKMDKNDLDSANNFLSSF